jgi:hypothetical protein
VTEDKICAGMRVPTGVGQVGDVGLGRGVTRGKAPGKGMSRRRVSLMTTKSTGGTVGDGIVVAAAPPPPPPRLGWEDLIACSGWPSASLGV